MSAFSFGNLKIYDRKTVSAREFNKLVDIVRSIVLNEGAGYRINRTPCGTNLTLGNYPGGSPPCPFTVTTSQDPETPGNVIVSVQAGTVNSLLPSNNFDTPSVDSTEIIQVKVEALSDGQAITSCSLIIDDNPPAVQEPTSFALPTTIDILIAVIVNGTPYRVIGCGSIQLTSTQLFVTNPTAPASPGTLNYNPWYIWAVGTV